MAATSISPIDQTLWLPEIISNAVLPQSDKNNHYLKNKGETMNEWNRRADSKINKQQEMHYMHNGDGLPFESCE